MNRGIWKNCCFLSFPTVIIIFPSILGLLVFFANILVETYLHYPQGAFTGNSGPFNNDVHTEEEDQVYCFTGPLPGMHDTMMNYSYWKDYTNGYVIHDETGFFVSDDNKMTKECDLSGFYKDNFVQQAYYVNYQSNCWCSPYVVPENKLDANGRIPAESLKGNTAGAIISKYKESASGIDFSIHLFENSDSYFDDFDYDDEQDVDIVAPASNLLHDYVNALFTKEGMTQLLYLGNADTYQWINPLAYLQSIVSLFILFLFPIALSFTFPNTASRVVREKKKGITEYMSKFGVTYIQNEVTRLFFDYMMYCFFCFFSIVVPLACLCDFFIHGHPYEYIPLFFLWGLCMISCAYFFSLFFDDPALCAGFGYMILFVFVVVGTITNMVVQSDELLPFYYFLIPPFAFQRALVNVIGVFSRACPPPPWYHFWIAMAYLVVETIVLFSIYLIVHNDLFRKVYLYIKRLTMTLVWKIKKKKNIDSEDNKNNNASSHLFSSKRIEDFHTLDNKEEEEEEEEEDINILVQPILPKDNLKGDDDSDEIHSSSINENRNEHSVDDYLDEDVYREKQEILSSKNLNQECLVIDGITKYFGVKKVLNEVFLTIRPNECFGLLGANGAGKTTLLSILTGSIAPSSGRGLVQGLDVTFESKKIRKITSICPQFDTLEGLMTVGQTLAFFARLRNVKGIKKHVNELLSVVNLENYRSRFVHNLSGGSRRRLSIAVSLVGWPKIVFLDEPSTGLDPASRRSVWDVIEKIKRQRTVVLTTHSMYEAETLCDRVGILSRGNLKCVGDLLHLKQRFGKGYHLTFDCGQEFQDQANEFIRSSLPPHVEISESKRTPDQLIYRISQNKVLFSEIFDRFDDDELKKYAITHWNINQCSLEEVFLRIVLGDETKKDRRKSLMEILMSSIAMVSGVTLLKKVLYGRKKQNDEEVLGGIDDWKHKYISV